MSSEGLIASFFYRMCCSASLKENPAPGEVYSRFGCTGAELLPATNLYLKILWAMMKIDWSRTTLFTDFVQIYLDSFEEDRAEVLKIFGEVTNFVTVDPAAQQMFGAI